MAALTITVVTGKEMARHGSSRATYFFGCSFGPIRLRPAFLKVGVSVMEKCAGESPGSARSLLTLPCIFAGGVWTCSPSPHGIAPIRSICPHRG